jgi:hypothetical protein
MERSGNVEHGIIESAGLEGALDWYRYGFSAPTRAAAAR